MRGAAVDIVRGLTGGEDGLRALTARADRALPALLRLLASAGGSDAGQAAADSLVNLSQDAGLATRLVAMGAVEAAMDVMTKRAAEQPALARSLVMLLVNLTHVESGVAALLQVRLWSTFSSQISCTVITFVGVSPFVAFLKSPLLSIPISLFWGKWGTTLLPSCDYCRHH